MKKRASLMSLFKSPLRPILLGIFIFLTLNLIFSIGVTCSRLNPKFNFSYGNFLPAKLDLLSQQAQRGNPPQILFIGTSQTNNGFIPRIFEKAAVTPLKSFNMGLPNNRYDIMLAYLQFHQQRYGKPKLLLVELSPTIQEQDASLYFLPALYYRTLIEQSPTLMPTYLSNPLLADNVKKELLFSGLSSLRQYRYTFSPINVLRKVQDKMDAFTGSQRAEASEGDSATHTTQTNPLDAYNATWMEQGWYPKPQSQNMTSPSGLQRSVTEARKFYIDPQTSVSFEKLQALLNYCRQQNIPVALVSWPNHPAFLQEFQKSPLHEAYQAGLTQLLIRQPVPFIDLNQEETLQTNQMLKAGNVGGVFADPRHLTPFGAANVSGSLAKRLLKVPGFPAILGQSG